MNPRTTKWFRNHAKYDDDHPRIALQIVARYAQTERARMKVMAAARRSLQLLNLALLTAGREYSYADRRTSVPQAAAAEPRAAELRVADRRRSRQPIAFPDRRVVERYAGSAAAVDGSRLAVAS